MLVDVRDRFEQPAVWGHLADDPKIRGRAQMFEEMIPERVERVLDVGCGDGAITDRLAQRWEVTGVDQSPTALSHVRTEAVLGSATNLPFPDNSFDLVLSSEMLEHLPADDYRRAIAEMSRVSRRYLLLSVPYREVLAFRTVRCPACGWRGHVWGHRQTFTPESLLADLAGYDAAQVRTFGPLQDPLWSRGLLWVSHHVLRTYYSAPGQSPLCERCGNTDFGATRPIGPRLQRINALIPPRGRPRMPFWLAVLAEATAPA
jgi:SAM-dependent methyltransferase